LTAFAFLCAIKNAFIFFEKCIHFGFLGTRILLNDECSIHQAPIVSEKNEARTASSSLYAWMMAKFQIKQNRSLWCKERPSTQAGATFKNAGLALKEVTLAT
jgi:hypothetical protein